MQVMSPVIKGGLGMDTAMAIPCKTTRDISPFPLCSRFISSSGGFCEGVVVVGVLELQLLLWRA